MGLCLKDTSRQGLVTATRLPACLAYLLLAQEEEDLKAHGRSVLAQQIRFMDEIINFLTPKGVIEPAMLFEAPFTDINAQSVAGLFEAPTASKIISLIENLNHNAGVA